MDVVLSSFVQYASGYVTVDVMKVAGTTSVRLELSLTVVG